jgi:hypothetical protein
MFGICGQPDKYAQPKQNEQLVLCYAHPVHDSLIQRTSFSSPFLAD